MQIGKITPEKKGTEEERLIRLLSERGVEDQETVKLMAEWIEKEQKLVESSAQNDVAPGILLNLRIARIYWAAGCKAEALSDFRDA